MAERRRYTKREKAAAVVAAVASSTLAAAEQAGIPESTLTYWMTHPEFVELRDKARAELAPLATTAAFLAWVEAIRLLREGKMEPRDVLFFAGIAIDKSQLLNGAATVRAENRDITDSFNDHETRALVDSARRYLGRHARREGAAVGEAPAVEAPGPTEPAGTER